MKVSIINIGDELLIGQVVNTNASWMSQHFLANGMDVAKVFVISDNKDDINNTLQIALQMSEAVVITGGSITQMLHSAFEQKGYSAWYVV